MRKLSKKIAAKPIKNIKDLIGVENGKSAIIANDIEYVEDKTYKGKGQDWNMQWLWLALFIVFFFNM